MSDQIVESGTSGIEPSANDSIQAQSASQISQPDESVEAALADRLWSKYFEPKVKPLIQSNKDVRFSKFEKDITEMKQRFTKELVDGGVPEQEAKEFVSRKFAPEQAAPTAQSVPEPAKPVTSSEIQRKVLTFAGLDQNDPDAILLLQRNLSIEQFINEVDTVKARRSAPANNAAIISGAKQPSPSMDELWAQYAERIKKDPMHAEQIKKEMGLT